VPTYDYECGACGHRFEKFQSITDPAVRKCPQCGRHKVKRLMGAGGGIIFKGSGFYQTDYRSKSYVEKKKKEEAPASNAGDSKPADSSKPKAPGKKED